MNWHKIAEEDRRVLTLAPTPGDMVLVPCTRVPCSNSEPHLEIGTVEYVEMCISFGGGRILDLNFTEETVVGLLRESQWIKCADRQPSESVKSWVFVEKTQATLVCRFNPDCWCWDDEDGDDFAYSVDEISHWQPYLVPAAPKET